MLYATSLGSLERRVLPLYILLLANRFPNIRFSSFGIVISFGICLLRRSFQPLWQQRQIMHAKARALKFDIIYDLEFGIWLSLCILQFTISNLKYLSPGGEGQGLPGEAPGLQSP